uniref:Uncharacterized protein n=1 Tax=Trypanosoma congolense (strain IL3000) TaxID=1068625 RepID=G0ULP7_TRYCI|nr:hypothetical protein, unlikely [Trypanosoma congolense IL3000]
MQQFLFSPFPRGHEKATLKWLKMKQLRGEDVYIRAGGAMFCCVLECEKKRKRRMWIYIRKENNFKKTSTAEILIITTIITLVQDLTCPGGNTVVSVRVCEARDPGGGPPLKHIKIKTKKNRKKNVVATTTTTEDLKIFKTVRRCS